jgi:hypothetical protein
MMLSSAENKGAVSKVVSNTKDTKNLFLLINSLCSLCFTLCSLCSFLLDF